MRLLEESYEKMQNMQILKILRKPSILNQEYTFNSLNLTFKEIFEIYMHVLYQ